MKPSGAIYRRAVHYLGGFACLGLLAALAAGCDGGSLVASSPPAQPTLPHWTQLSEGDRHSLGIKSDGTLWAWGLNLNGQLGSGNTTPHPRPSQIGNATNWSQVAGGIGFSVGLRTDGTVWAWGNNSAGQLGNGDPSFAPSLTPVQVCAPAAAFTCTTFLTGIVGISAGDDFALAVKGDSTVWAWGNNASGQLGNNDGVLSATNNKPTHVCAPGAGTPPCTMFLSNVSTIAAGSAWSFAIQQSGALFAWGNQSAGVLGNGQSTGASLNDPIAIDGTHLYSAVAAGQGHSIGLRTDGSVWAWGANGNGQLGNDDGTLAGQSTPQPVCAPGAAFTCTTFLTGIARIAAGQNLSMALGSNGALYSWGDDQSGGLGIGGAPANCGGLNCELEPVLVGASHAWTYIVTGNTRTSMALQGGERWAWGRNTELEFGNGATTGSNVPLHIP